MTMSWQFHDNFTVQRQQLIDAEQVPGLNVCAVGHLAGLLRVVLVLVHDEREAGRRPRHPDLAERPELAEGLLEVPLRGLNTSDFRPRILDI